MLALVTIALILIALLLLLRFVQPEFIYSIRREVVMVASNKAFIDKMAGRDDVDAAYKQVLLSEARLESRTYDEISILQDRIVKITELYRLLDSRRNIAKTQKPQVCIVELGALLTNLGRGVEANPEHNAPVVKSGALLKYIADGILMSRNEAPVDEKAVDRWFIKNPISIEQVVELLIAAVVGLAHRRQAARASAVDALSAGSIDAWSEINVTEKRLRLFVRARLQQKYSVEHAINQRVQESLGEAIYQECVQRMDEARRNRPGLALDFFDFVYWYQLEALILAEWELFLPVFEEKAWLTPRVARIVAVRGDEAQNGQGASEDDKRLAIQYCQEIRSRIEQ